MPARSIGWICTPRPEQIAGQLRPHWYSSIDARIAFALPGDADSARRSSPQTLARVMACNRPPMDRSCILRCMRLIEAVIANGRCARGFGLKSMPVCLPADCANPQSSDVGGAAGTMSTTSWPAAAAGERDRRRAGVGMVLAVTCVRVLRFATGACAVWGLSCRRNTTWIASSAAGATVHAGLTAWNK